MTSGTHRTRILTIPRVLAAIGFALLVLGFILASAAEAQSGAEPAPTRYVSIFDAAATAAPTMVEATAEATAETTAEPASTSPTQQAATPAPQVTRFTSMFDAPSAASSNSPAPTESIDDTASPTPVPQVTRFTSVFDTAPAGDNAAATPVPEVTRFTSVFDTAAPTAANPDQPAQPTRIPSIFDSQSAAAPANPYAPAAQATPYVSVFDSAPGAVVRYQGDEPPPAEYCLGCHESPYLQMSLPDGEVISVTVDEEAYKNSVHGQHGTEGYRCIRCHEGMNEYPHAEVAAQTSRELIIEMSTACARCHTDKYDETRDDLHVALMARGVENAATCADCHTGHEVQRLSDETTGMLLSGSAATSAQMCSGCHSEIYAAYSESVHGQSVLSGNNDAATCADCHGVHSTEGPSTSPFLLFSPQICAGCHADESLMATYSISTDVFETYVADFHGTTVSLFQATSPDQAFNAPVCADCHGVHNIMAVESADSPVIKDNLIETCRRCHPSATTNFSSAWLSHYPPSFERTPIIAVANLAYTVAIPAIIGMLALFVVADARRRRRSEREKDR